MSSGYEFDETPIRTDWSDFHGTNEAPSPLTPQQSRVLMELQPIFFESGLAKKFIETHGDGEAASAELAFAIAKYQSVLEDDKNKLTLSMVRIHPVSGKHLLGSVIDIGDIDKEAASPRKLDKFPDGTSIFSDEDLKLAEQIYLKEVEAGLDIWAH